MANKRVIVNRWSGKVLWEGEAESTLDALRKAREAGADLRGAVLRGADLRDAVLTGADLRGADLTDADLTDAVLTGADLRGADLTDADLTDAVLRGADLRDAVLTGADLRGADLTDADLTDADLRGADLTDADLTDAVLTGADLRGADLTDADLTDAVLRGAVLTGADLTDAVLTGAVLTPFRDDLWAVLSGSPAEVQTLLEKVNAGEIDGSCYEGTCCCLVGTLANARHCDYREIPTIAANSSRPAERWFALIKPGDTPATSQPAKLAAEWIEDWLVRMRLAFAAVPAA